MFFTSGSALISAASRLAGALIMLGGGRYTEKMRTIGIAKYISYANLVRVVGAILENPALAITYDGSLAALKAR